MEPFTAEQLTRNMALTPEGFLICYNVPFARTGRMPYVDGEIVTAEGESRLIPGEDGIIWVERSPDVVFAPRAMASFEGKAVTDDHPPFMLKPHTTKEYSVGHMQNVRRGDGVWNDYLVSDLFITDPVVIKKIRAGKREVSAGYDADYEQTVPGVATMASFLGNHLALVRKGRCGTTCAITDKGDIIVSKPSIIDKLKAAFTLGDNTAFETALKDLPSGDLNAGTALSGNGVHIHVGGHAKDEGTGVIAPDSLTPQWFAGAMDGLMKPIRDSIEELKNKGEAMDKRLATMDAAIKARTGDSDGDDDEATTDADEGDDKVATKDSAETLVLFRHTLSDAKILDPSISVPTMDGAASVKTTKASLCKLRRSAVRAALGRTEAKGEIAPLLMGRTLDSMPCSEVKTVFLAGAQILRSANNRGIVTNSGSARDGHHTGYVPPSNADRNAKASAFWANPINNGNNGGA